MAVIHVYRCIQHIIRTLLATSNPPPPSEEPPEVIELEPFSDADDIPIQLTTITGDIPVRMIGEEIPRRQERTRGYLAIALTVIFAGVLFVPFFVIDRWADSKEWLQSALPAVTGLLGSAFGFYFGQRNN